MALSTNAWNRLRYTVWSLGYDAFTRPFLPLRRQSIAQAALQPGERVLLVGAGTGADLPLLPAGLDVLATDLTPAMLARARQWVESSAERKVRLAVMDGHALGLPDARFDAVLLHLILAVIPDPARCLAEAARVLRPGGRVAVLDKFLADDARPSLARRLANLASGLLVTEINRRMGEILERSRAPLTLERDQPAALGGFFRVLLLRKPHGAGGASPPSGP
ncbi:MAG TPA: methyltransferase domain-containing protein [Vicinamibacteria bacterium]|nr:methyltransferase domain-containing protein [Vicinamibacteria bacterium]